MNTVALNQRRSNRGRRLRERIFLVACVISAAVAMMVLATLLISIVAVGASHLTWDFLVGFASKDAASSGILPALLGSLYTCAICAIIAIFLGVGTAILIEEYQPKHWVLRRIHGFVQLNITNLAGVPSIVYGILGVTAFSNMFGLMGLPGQTDYAIGQRWFDQYVTAAGQQVFVPVPNRLAPLTGAQSGLTFYHSMDLEQVVKLRFLSAEEVAPQRDKLLAQMGAYEDTLREGIEKLRGGERHIGPVAITSQQAEALATAALDQVTFQSDEAALRGKLVQQLLALQGQDSRALREARRVLINLAVDQEFSHQLGGVLVTGSAPLRVDRKAWYYLSLPLGRSILAGGLTLALVVLPIVIVASQESLRAVPSSMRDGVLALGGTKWQSISKIALPAAIPGICTGTILAMSRAIGEAAPLLILAGVVFISFTPANPMDSFTVMPLQIYNWASKPGWDFRQIAATGIIVLLAMLLTFNAVAVILRQKTQKSY
jgi:phosphate transport system permease protein